MALAPASHIAALLALLPRGLAWPRDPDAILARLVAGLAQTAARLDARADVLLREAFPVAPVELLPEWEGSLGLPDPCVGSGQTTDQRQAAVAARFASRGGQSAAYFAAVAAAMGATITITTYKAALAGEAVVGDPVQGDSWAHAWTVTTAGAGSTVARAGTARVGDPLQAWSNAGLECVLQRLAPAHTTLTFVYS